MSHRCLLLRSFAKTSSCLALAGLTYVKVDACVCCHDRGLRDSKRQPLGQELTPTLNWVGGRAFRGQPLLLIFSPNKAIAGGDAERLREFLDAGLEASSEYGAERE